MALSGDLDLVEFERRALPRAALAEAEARAILDDYARWIDVEWPSPRTGDRWAIRPRGVVGHLPLPTGRVVRVHPKLPVASVWAMVEGAAGTKGVAFLEGSAAVAPSEAIYSRLVALLAQGVEARARRGFAHAYVQRADPCGVLRGRVDVTALARRPACADLPCVFDEHTGDIDDNRILAAALARALRGPLLDPSVRRRARAALRLVSGVATAAPMRGADCAGRPYTRLTVDYERLHALSRFVLDALAPSERAGDRAMVPFVLDLARVFERFVASRLCAFVSPRWEVLIQRRVPLAGGGAMAFQVDLVLRDRARGAEVAVLDTKYKGDVAPAEADVQQVVAYATALQCSHAFLVHAAPVEQRLRVGSVTVHVVGVDLRSEDLDGAVCALWSRVRDVVEGPTAESVQAPAPARP